VAGVEHRAGDVLARAQPALHLAQPDRVGVLARRDADDALEIALEMVRASADSARERRERWMAVHVVEVHAGASDLVDPRIGRRSLVGPAAAAGAKPGAPRLFGAVEEGDVLAARPSARAGRPAVDSGGGDGVHERAVGVTIAGDD